MIHKSRIFAQVLFVAITVATYSTSSSAMEWFGGSSNAVQQGPLTLNNVQLRHQIALLKDRVKQIDKLLESEPTSEKRALEEHKNLMELTSKNAHFLARGIGLIVSAPHKMSRKLLTSQTMKRMWHSRGATLPKFDHKRTSSAFIKECAACSSETELDQRGANSCASWFWFITLPIDFVGLLAQLAWWQNWDYSEAEFAKIWSDAPKYKLAPMVKTWNDEFRVLIESAEKTLEERDAAESKSSAPEIAEQGYDEDFVKLDSINISGEVGYPDVDY